MTNEQRDDSNAGEADEIAPAERQNIIPFSEGDEPAPRDEPGSKPAAAPSRAEELKGVVEALLFASDRPLSSTQLAELSGAADGHEARRIVTELQAEYDSAGRAFCIEETGGGFRFASRPQYHRWISKLKKDQQVESLSQAALETLAIVAYRQPIMRAEIEDIRGVQCDYILRSLMEKGLVRVAGRSDELGRPLLYGTTRKMLEVFGLRSLEDLPDAKELARG